jgi:Ser/Thr protein kinase RdoA (MazF antagonist)
VHGDVWARNAIQSSPSGVTFVGWETGGLGLAVVDLGNTLLECHLDADLPDYHPSGWLIEPSAERIAAVAAGYASTRPLSAPELDLLPAAVTFSAAVVGSVDLDVAMTDAVTGPVMEARLARLENRLGVADEVAFVARDYLAS